MPYEITKSACALGHRRRPCRRHGRGALGRHRRRRRHHRVVVAVIVEQEVDHPGLVEVGGAHASGDGDQRRVLPGVSAPYDDWAPHDLREGEEGQVVAARAAVDSPHDHPPTLHGPVAVEVGLVVPGVRSAYLADRGSAQARVRFLVIVVVAALEGPGHRRGTDSCRLRGRGGPSCAWDPEGAPGGLAP